MDADVTVLIFTADVATLSILLGGAVAALASEPWLEEQYGEPYREYLRRVPRFL